MVLRKNLCLPQKGKKPLPWRPELVEMGYHVCLHHLGIPSKDPKEIQENVSNVIETMEILDEERLEVCVSLMPSEMGYLKSNKGGENHCRKIGQNFGTPRFCARCGRSSRLW